MGRGPPFKQSYTALVRAKIVPRPRWLGAVTEVPPQIDLVERTRPPAITFPEDRLRSVFLQRNPETRQLPIDLNTSRLEERHISDRFVALQQRYMDDGNGEEEAYSLAYESLGNTIQGEEGIELAAGKGENATVDSESARAFIASLKYAQRDRKLFDQIKRREDSLTMSHDEEI